MIGEIEMETLEKYFNKHFDSDELFQYQSALNEYVSISDSNNLLSAIVLDSIFDFLYHYTYIVISTESQKNYSLDDPFDYLIQIFKLLGFDMSINEIRRHRSLGNPSRNKEALTKMLGKGKQETYRSQYVARILKNSGLHEFVNNIEILLDMILQHDLSKRQQQIKTLFGFYILNLTFHLLKSHVYFDEWHTQHYPYTTIYKKRIEDELNKKKGTSIRVYSAMYKIKYKEAFENFIEGNYNRISNIMSDYFNQNMNLSIDSQFWSELSKLKHITTSLKNRLYIDEIKSIRNLFKEYFIIGEENQYDGNLNYIKDIYKSMFQDVNRFSSDLFSKEQTISDFKQMRYDTIRNSVAYSLKCSVSDEGVDVITNPFIEMAPVLLCDECPFRLYASSVIELSSAIKNSIYNDRKYLGEVAADILGNRKDPMYSGAINELRTVLDSLRIVNYPEIIRFKIIKTKKLNKSVKWIQGYGKKSRNELSKEQVKMLQQANRFVHNTYDFFAPVAEILIAKKKGVCIDDYLNSMEESTVDFLLLHKLDGKESNNFDANKPFPYLIRRTIAEWKNYFRTFCIRESDISVKGTHDIPDLETYRVCFKKFLEALRKVYIENMIWEIRNIGYVTWD